FGPGGDADPRVGFGRLVGDGPVEDEDPAELGGRAQSADDVQAVGVAVVDEHGEGVDGVHAAAAEVGGDTVGVGLHGGDAEGEVVVRVGDVGRHVGEPVEHVAGGVDGGQLEPERGHGDGDAPVPAPEVHHLRPVGDDGGEHAGLRTAGVPVGVLGDTTQRVDRGRE